LHDVERGVVVARGVGRVFESAPLNRGEEAIYVFGCGQMILFTSAKMRSIAIACTDFLYCFES
jgi:hypothetical protein